MSMATINDLPAELIAHILHLAFLEYDHPARRLDTNATLRTHQHGLARCALVHSSWRAPAQAILALDLHFSRRTDRARLGHLLASRGRTAEKKLKCVRLEVTNLRPGELVGLLGVIEAGAVRELRLALSLSNMFADADPFEEWPDDMFEHEALSGLQTLWICSGYDHDHWPSTLTRLEVGHLSTVEQVCGAIVASSATLSQIKLDTADEDCLEPVVGLIANLTNELNSIDLTLPFISPNEPVPPALIATILSLPHHASPAPSLSLHSLSPTHLDQLLTALPRFLHLAQLTTTVLLPAAHLNELWIPFSLADWTTALERCLAHPSASQVGLWRFRVLSESYRMPQPPLPRRVGEADLVGHVYASVGGEEGGARWAALKAVVAGRGCQFMYDEGWGEDRDPFFVREDTRDDERRRLAD